MQSSPIFSSAFLHDSHESHSFVCLMSLSGEFLYLNEEIFGIHRKMNAAQLMHPDDLNFLFNHISAITDNPAGIKLSLRFQTGFNTQYTYTGVVRLAHTSELSAYPGASNYTLAFTKPLSDTAAVLHTSSDFLRVFSNQDLETDSQLFEINEHAMDAQFENPISDMSSAHLEEWVSLTEETTNTRKSSTTSYLSNLDTASSVFTPNTANSTWYSSSVCDTGYEEPYLSPHIDYVPEDMGLKGPEEFQMAEIQPFSEFDHWPAQDTFSCNHVALMSPYLTPTSSSCLESISYPADLSTSVTVDTVSNESKRNSKRSSVTSIRSSDRPTMIHKHSRKYASSSKGSKQRSNGRKAKVSKPCAAGHECSECGVSESPEWRKGPAGPKSLCNACGLRFSKYRSRSTKFSAISQIIMN